MKKWAILALFTGAIVLATAAILAGRFQFSVPFDTKNGAISYRMDRFTGHMSVCVQDGCFPIEEVSRYWGKDFGPNNFFNKFDEK